MFLGFMISFAWSRLDSIVRFRYISVGSRGVFIRRERKPNVRLPSRMLVEKAALTSFLLTRKRQVQ